jgi:methylmalonyl-CoA/ethylmalonyl-CoA epimerase
MIKSFAHIGIGVRSLEEALHFYRDVLGLELHKTETLGDGALRAALLRLGDTEIELLEPLASDTGLARFLERRGEGLHHVALATDDAAAAMARVRERGVEPVEEAPRRGLSGWVFFLPVQACHGTLVEIEEPAE